MEHVWSAESCAKLLKKHSKTPTGWHACCPAHDDKNPSLYLADGDDGVALKCYAGCSYENIASALESMGARVFRDQSEIPTTHKQLGPYRSHWDYLNVSGETIMRICRWERGEGKKEIRPLVKGPDGWEWKHHPTPRPLFGLDRLAKTEGPVLVVEGEKTALAAQKLFPDYTVTTWPGGASSVNQTDWSPLKGRTVTLIPDCDAVGRKAMDWVKQSLANIAEDTRIVDPATKANVPEGWDLADAADMDVSDWLSVEKRVSRIKRISEILANPSKPRWLIRDVLEAGVIALVAGPRGSYKSFVACHWAMTIAVEGSTVLMVSAEGAGLDRRVTAWAKRHAPKINRAGVPLYAIEQRINFNEEEATKQLCDEIDALEEKPALIIIDTLSKNSGGLDENSNSEVKAFIGRIDNHLKRRYGATVLLIHHTGHGEQKRARGASALEADTDAAYIITRSAGTPFVTVSRERFKDSPDLGPLSYKAEVIDLMQADDDGNPVTSLALVPVDQDTVKTETRGNEPRGLRQKTLLKALRKIQTEADELKKSAGEGPTPSVWTPIGLRDIARTVGMSKQSAQDAAAAVAAFYLQPTVGGYRLKTKAEAKA